MRKKNTAVRGSMRGLAILISAATCGLALADEPPAAPPTLSKACAADYQTLCADVQPGGGRVKACFRKNAAKLSPECKAALKDAGAASKNGPAA